MAVAYATESTVLTGSGTSVTVNVPSGTTNGDLLILSGNTGSGSSGFAVTGGGWSTLIAPWTDSNDSAGFIFYRVASSEPASYTVTWTTSAGDFVFAMRRFTGASTTTPIRTSRIDHATGTGASFASTALSGVQATDLTVMIAQMGDDAGNTTYTVTEPGSPWASIDSLKETGGPKYQGAVSATGSQSGATWTSSVSTAYWNVSTFAIEAASTGGPIPYLSQNMGRY